METCKRCGGKTGLGLNLIVTLIGGFRTFLCPACQNAWHVYYELLPEHNEIQVLDARRHRLEARAIAGDAPSEEEFLHLLKDRSSVEARLFALGETWVQASVTAAT